MKHVISKFIFLFQAAFHHKPAPFTSLIIPTLISPEPVPETKKLGALLGVTNLERRLGVGLGDELQIIFILKESDQQILEVSTKISLNHPSF